MYLTQMPLNPARRSTRELLASPQRTHATLLSGFLPGAGERDRILWRVDSDARHQVDLFVVSPIAPSLDAMAEQAGWSTQPVWRSTDYRPFLDRLEAGQVWRFRLTANPTVSVRSAPGSRGKRIPLVRDSEHVAWLLARSEGHGFSVLPGAHGLPNLRTSNLKRQRFERRSDGHRRVVTLLSVQFDGVLKVNDPGLLRHALVAGIGSAKGYGCGLMTLASS